MAGPHIIAEVDAENTEDAESCMSKALPKGDYKVAAKQL